MGSNADIKIVGNGTAATANAFDGFAKSVNTPPPRDLWDWSVLEKPEPDKSLGFILVSGGTWLPKPLYEARRRHQRKMARENESAVVWTR